MKWSQKKGQPLSYIARYKRPWLPCTQFSLRRGLNCPRKPHLHQRNQVTCRKPMFSPPAEINLKLTRDPIHERRTDGHPLRRWYASEAWVVAGYNITSRLRLKAPPLLRKINAMTENLEVSISGQTGIAQTSLFENALVVKFLELPLRI